jgi:elongation factor G
MKEAMKREDLFPLFCVSSERMIGVRALLTEIVQLMPSAYEMEELHAFTGAEGGQTVEIHAEDARPFAALVFKTHAEPHVGDVSYFRVLQGSVAGGQEVYNATRDVAEKLNHLAIPLGRDARGGAAAARRRHRLRGQAAQHAHERHAVHARAPGAAAAAHFPSRSCTSPCTPRAATSRRSCRPGSTAARRGPDVHRGLQARDARDRWWAAWASATSRSRWPACAASTAWGRAHAADHRLPRDDHRRRAGQGRHKKQTGGKGQFGDCWIRMAPLPRGEGYLFEDRSSAA